MATKRTATRAPRQKKVKQGHKLVWLTLIILAIPVAIVGYVLLTSLDEQNQPVEGIRFSQNDLNPKITNQQINQLQSSLSQIGGVEGVTVNLKSATLRIHLNTSDNMSREEIAAVLNAARDTANGVLPFDTYFTNTDNGKNYDIEIDAYNYIPDQDQYDDNWIYFKLTKTGAGGEVTDEITAAKNPDLVAQITGQQAATALPEEDELDPNMENPDGYYYQ